MTAIRDPYPSDLATIDADTTPFEGTPYAVDPQDQTVKVLNRIAVALEQIALNQLDKPVQNAPGAALAALPPVRTVPVPVVPQTADVCPIHGTPWKVVPAGISKKSGKAYDAFRACSTAGCDQRPR